MGLTFARAFLRAKSKPEDLMILEKGDSTKIDHLRSLDVAQVYTTYDCIPLADIIIFAVKPQDAVHLFDSIRDHVQQDQILLSIMAGIQISTIQQYFTTDKVLRAMPNLPSKIGFGMTAYTSSDTTSRVEMNIIHNLLSTTGRAIYIDDESLIDAVTAISGSGPAYVFYFMKSMIDAALKLGLNQVEAELLVNQTFFGSISLYQQSNLNCEEWISQVASRGGTTEAALTSFDKASLHEAIQQGIVQAHERAKELGG